MKILLVDDSKTMRNIQKRTLATLPEAEFVEAGDGVEGLAAMASAGPNGFQLVLVDWNMPNMDGITLVKEIKQKPDYKFTPIIMLTTESQDDMKAQGQAAGARAWVVKPFQPAQMLAAVSKLIAP